MWLKILFSVVLVLSLTGCATSRKEIANIQTMQLEMRVKQLEKDVQQKDKKIYELENKLQTDRERKIKIYPEKKGACVKGSSNISNVTPKKIQTALKKAGFYNGSIDGKIGKKTKRAVKEFQKANGLDVDGIVGGKTWARLVEYLDEQ